jgi:biopolymer transport protein ExbD
MSFTEGTRHRARPTMPLAPMLDMMFLLLIFFATTSTFRAEEQQIDVDVPAAQTATAVEPTRTEVVVNILDNGAIKVGATLYTPEELQGMLEALIREVDPNTVVTLRGDKNTNYATIISVLDAVRAAGVESTKLATIKRASDLGG